MKATKLIINGEVQEIESEGSTGLPGVCVLSVEYIGNVGQATIISGEIENGAIVEMKTVTGTASDMDEIEIDNETYDVIPYLSKAGGDGIIRTKEKKIFILENYYYK